MCGRYASLTGVEPLVEIFDIDVPTFDAWPRRYNVAPTQQAPVILRGREGERRLGTLRWGLIPSWAREASIGSRMINARSETVASKPAFRDAYRSRRCLVPIDHFYEWRRDEPDNPEGSKTPFLIRPASGAPFAVAGLWESWRPPAGEALYTFTLLTTTPSRWMSQLHDRMPVVIQKSEWGTWLAPDAVPAELEGLMKPAPESFFEAFEISRAVNSPRNDDPAVAEPLPGGEVIPQAGTGSAETSG